jgi:hypothetical protein
MSIPAFSPGSFTPVVEVVREPPAPFFDTTVGEEFCEPKFQFGGYEAALVVQDVATGCFESAQLDSSVPFVHPDHTLLVAAGTLAALPAHEVYGCPCFLTQFDVLSIPSHRIVLDALSHHECGRCGLCATSLSPFYNHRLWLKSYSQRGRANPTDALWTFRRAPKHPSRPGSRYLVPHNVGNPWIDKHVTNVPPDNLLDFPVLSLSWLFRKIRFMNSA